MLECVPPGLFSSCSASSADKLSSNSSISASLCGSFDTAAFRPWIAKSLSAGDMPMNNSSAATRSGSFRMGSSVIKGAADAIFIGWRHDSAMNKSRNDGIRIVTVSYLVRLFALCFTFITTNEVSVLHRFTCSPFFDLDGMKVYCIEIIDDEPW
mmetsp:Transcript_8629/g.15629  ORF Transcript_8629/g.15629 Transcript_8629/m.15629 type:complete len:154 (+) Transcript_8629:790-1251(+)